LLLYHDQYTECYEQIIHPPLKIQMMLAIRRSLGDSTKACSPYPDPLSIVASMLQERRQSELLRTELRQCHSGPSATMGLSAGLRVPLKTSICESVYIPGMNVNALRVPGSTPLSSTASCSGGGVGREIRGFSHNHFIVYLIYDRTFSLPSVGCRCQITRGNL
jgi:hypothetical protein